MNVDRLIESWRSYWLVWYEGFSIGLSIGLLLVTLILCGMSIPHNDWAIGSESGGMVLAWVMGYWWGKRR